MQPYFEVNDLAWVLKSPGLLNESYFGPRIVGDRELFQQAQLLNTDLQTLASDPGPLLSFLSERATGGRLGRYFENLLQFYLAKLRAVENLHSNIQVRGLSGRTVGEFDLLFRDPHRAENEHWEASVKFYICTSRDQAEAQATPFYMGTLVHDRLDRKLKKFFEAQLRLGETSEGERALNRIGLSTVSPRALLKGYLFYPADVDWQSHPSPTEISPTHQRGWWLTAGELETLPERDSNSLYMTLPFARWLSRLHGWVIPDQLLSRPQLSARVRRLFDSSWARPVHYEMMVAEVSVIEERDGKLLVQEVSRGNILHPRWPQHARKSLETTA